MFGWFNMVFLVVAIAPWVVLVYALLVIGGGVLGYVNARSKPSLISGVISGIALLGAFALSLYRYNVGIGLAMILAIALGLVFVIRFRKTRQWIPAGLMASLSLVVAIVCAIARLA